MYQFSDSDSVDSDEGIRYKTESIRNKKSDDKSTRNERQRESYNHRERDRSRSRSRSRSHRHTEKKKLKKRKKDYSPEDRFSRKSSSRSKHRESDTSDNRKRRKEKDKSTKEDSTSQKNKSNEDCNPVSPNLHTNENITDQKQELDSEHEKNKSSDSSTSSTTTNTPFGPTLPPIANTEQTAEDNLQNGNTFGPQLPPHLAKKTSKEDSIIGPVLPPHFITVSSLDDDSSDDIDTSKSEESSQNSTIGPTLPPHLSKKNEGNIVGPVIPPRVDQDNLQSVKDEESEDEEVYGPVPAGAQYTQAHVELEERALQMKMDQLDSSGNKQPVREEWMLTLPEAKAAKFGLGPRQFRSKPAPDLSDRSSWTDTPEDKAKKKEGKVEPKLDLKREAELKQLESRNLEQEKIAKKHRKEKESLLDIHRKKLKEKKNESGPSERRPFSREIDLQVNRFDEAQKKAVLKKAQLLDTRFSSGESKYL